MYQTIYFRKDVWNQFKDEEDKSKVINQLLMNHYANKKIDYIKKELTIPKVIISDMPAPNITYEIKASPKRLDNGLCKIHGVPLDDRGKCLQKGCKYV